MATRLLIVDDDPEITSTLVRRLRIHGYEAEAANRADLALQLLQDGGFSGAMIDVILGADSGLELVRAARERRVTMPLLMLSALPEVEDRAAGLGAGVNDYVVKPFSFEELVARLRVQELRTLQELPEPARLSRTHRRLIRGETGVDLTDREIDLLALLTRKAGTTLPRGEIFDALWATEGSSSENVVDVYAGYVRKKLKDHDFGIEIRTIRNRGFQLDGLAPKLDSP